MNFISHLMRVFFITERKSTVFSSQSFIIVAGNINETFLTPNSVQDVSPEEMLRNLIKPFHGKLVGFFFNDVKVLDWAAEGTDLMEQYAKTQF